MLGCAVPELILAIDGAAEANEPDRVKALSGRVREFLEWTARLPTPHGIKEALRQRKIDAGAPATGSSTTEREKLDEFASWFGPWLAHVRAECGSLSKEGRSGGR